MFHYTYTYLTQQSAAVPLLHPEKAGCVNTLCIEYTLGDLNLQETLLRNSN
jgi:hypothetical protein